MDILEPIAVNNAFLKDRQNLPIWPHRNELVNAVKRNENCVIISSTGTGKTTQLPQFLFDAGLASKGTIAITQPRRLAAISVAQRVAEEMGRGAVGHGPVGYCVRFEDVSDTNRTRLRYMTDGMLLREAILDPLLSRYSIVIVDEAHERSLNTEVLLGVVLNASQKRKNLHNPTRILPPFKIIIMSATIDPNAFVKFLGPKSTQVIYMEGRRFPIKVLNTLITSTDYVADAATTTIQMHKVTTCPPDRGFLVFLTGEEEISRCVGLIRRLYNSLVATEANKKGGGSKNNQDKLNSSIPKLIVFPLFSSLPQSQQLKALNYAKQGVRKVIVCTNIAETSLTIPGIRYVVDCGRAKHLDWDPVTGLESLRIRWISQSQAWQRSGRAGREAPGVCLRIYTDDEYNRMPLHPTSQLLKAPFAGVLLCLLSMEVQDINSFPWLEAPKASSIQSGMKLLVRLGAVAEHSPTYDVTNSNLPVYNGNSSSIHRPVKLTKLGRLMTAFPLSPRLARTLISAVSHGCIVEAITVVSMLYVAPVFYVPQDARDDYAEVVQRFRNYEGDLASLVLVYRAYNKVGKKNSNIDNCSQGGHAVTRKSWCRENYLNFTRLATAVKVRGQLKSIVQGSGLCNVMNSCGHDDFTPLTKAFFDVAYRDQVAVLASNRVKKRLNESQEGAAFPCYIRLEDADNISPNLLSIHPDSQLYSLAVIARNPPSAVLFIDAVDADANNTTVQEAFECSAGENESLSQRRVLMRHVCVLSTDWLVDSNVVVTPVGLTRKRTLSEPTTLNESITSTTTLDSYSSVSTKKRRRRNKKNRKNRLLSDTVVMAAS